MSEKRSGGIRRVTRKDRKRKLETGELFFPAENEAAAATPDDSRYAPPDALTVVETPPEAVLPEAKPAEPEITPPVIKEPPPAPPRPQAERFPPLEFAPEPKPMRRAAPAAKPAAKPAAPRRNTCLPNLLTGVFLLASLVFIGWTALVWNDPYTPLNPLAPFTPLPIIITTTPLPPTPTLSPTPAPPTPSPTFTPLAIEATAARSLFSFGVAPTGVVYVPNGNGQECAWSSIAGSVTDSGGLPLDDYQVHVIGENFEQIVFTGAALTYGAGGFEMPLGDVPRAAEYTVQLLDPDGVPLSDLYTVPTRAECDQNVAIVSFVPQ